MKIPRVRMPEEFPEPKFVSDLEGWLLEGKITPQEQFRLMREEGAKFDTNEQEYEEY